MIFVSPHHDFAGHEQVRWTELDNQPIITLTQKSNIRLLTEIGFEQAKLALRPHMEVNQIHSVLSLVEVNAGIAVLPAYAFTALRGRGIVARPRRTRPSCARCASSRPRPRTVCSHRRRTIHPAKLAAPDDPRNSRNRQRQLNHFYACLPSLLSLLHEPLRVQMLPHRCLESSEKVDTEQPVEGRSRRKQGNAVS